MDCIIQIEEPLIGNFSLKMPRKVICDNPIHKIYVICDPRKTEGYMYSEDEEGEQNKLFLFEEPFYVGQSLNIKDRWKNHIRESDQYLNFNPLKEELIREIIAEGLKPIWTIIKENLYQEEANKWERYFIKLIGRMGKGLGPLLNMVDGGKGTHGHIVSEEAKEKSRKRMENRIISENQKIKTSLSMKKVWEKEEFREKMQTVHKNLWETSEHIEKMKIVRSNKETRLKISIANKGKYYGKIGEMHHSYGKSKTEESKIKQSEAMKGKTQTKEWVQNRKHRIYIYEITDPYGNIHIIDNLNEFSKERGIRPQSLQRVADNSRKSYKKWKVKIIFDLIKMK